jgi:two-component system sensor histidine kinase HydH
MTTAKPGIFEEGGRAEALERLAAGIAHEIRNPLAGMKVLVQHLREKSSDPHDRQDLSVVEGEIDRIGEIIERFLAFARPFAPSMKRLPLQDVVEDSLFLVRRRAEGQGVTLGVSLPAAPLTAPLDRSLIKQVLLNLLLNALDAMPTGGKVHVGVEAEAGGWIAVRVADTGKGIAETLAERLFEPFATARENGLGLGLAISRSIAEAHGGELRLEKTGPEGTTFLLRLPR